MENEKHIVYQSLIKKPKIAGLSHSLFGVLMMSIVIVVLVLGISWVGISVCIIFGFTFRHFLIEAEEKDALFLLLWIGKIFRRDNHYQARAPINHRSSKKTKSILTLH